MGNKNFEEGLLNKAKITGFPTSDTDAEFHLKWMILVEDILSNKQKSHWKVYDASYRTLQRSAISWEILQGGEEMIEQIKLSESSKADSNLEFESWKSVLDHVDKLSGTFCFILELRTVFVKLLISVYVFVKDHHKTFYKEKYSYWPPEMFSKRDIRVQSHLLQVMESIFDYVVRYDEAKGKFKEKVWHLDTFRNFLMKRKEPGKDKGVIELMKQIAYFWQEGEPMMHAIAESTFSYSVPFNSSGLVLAKFINSCIVVLSGEKFYEYSEEFFLRALAAAMILLDNIVGVPGGIFSKKSLINLKELGRVLKKDNHSLNWHFI